MTSWLINLIPCAQISWHSMLSKLMRMFCIRNRRLTSLKFFQQCLRDNGSNRGVLHRVEDLDVWQDRLGIFMLGKSCGNLFPEFLHWGCREHFVSGCWHSFGRDCGRYPRECRLSALEVLRPGVPVMWKTHIRDLSPTAGSCKGGRLTQGNKVALGVRQHWCKAVMVWWLSAGWEGAPPHFIAHTTC